MSLEVLATTFMLEKKRKRSKNERKKKKMHPDVDYNSEIACK